MFSPEKILEPAGLQMQFTHEVDRDASNWPSLTPPAMKGFLVTDLHNLSRSPSNLEVTIWLLLEISSEREKNHWLSPPFELPFQILIADLLTLSQGSRIGSSGQDLHSECGY